MSTIGGPGGIGGGPKGPGGVDGPDEAADVGDVGDVGDVAADASIERAGASTRSGDIDSLSAEVAAGRLTPREAIDQLVDAAAGPELDATERAELRELLTELVANDPYLGSLVGRV